VIMCTEDEFGAAPPWQDELIALARNITQDDDPPRSPEEEAKELAGEVLSDPRAAEDPLLADMIDQAEQVAAGEWLEKG